jgi:hypothetical protein
MWKPLLALCLLVSTCCAQQPTGTTGYTTFGPAGTITYPQQQAPGLLIYGINGMQVMVTVGPSLSATTQTYATPGVNPSSAPVKTDVFEDYKLDPNPHVTIPTVLNISGKLWSLEEVVGYSSETTVGETDCKAHKITYVWTSSDGLREDLWHEIFHAGACDHGGDVWWNSIKPNNVTHPGIYHLAEFMQQFVKDNPAFMQWAELK